MHTDCPAYNDKCHECYNENIKSSSILTNDTSKAWNYLYDRQIKILKDMYSSDIDARLEIIGLYITVPALFHESIRSIFIKYFATKGISEDSLERGKWLPYHINLKRDLLSHLWLTQKIEFPNIHLYLDALDFFTKENLGMHRGKAAHRTTEALIGASHILYLDVFKKFCTLMRCAIAFEVYILKSSSLFKCYLQK